MEKNIDIRIVKTQRAINSVFFELMNEIGFSKINVQKIIERAEINRSTFYAHYLDKFDLLDKVENNLLICLKNIENEVPVELVTDQGFNAETLISHIKHVTNYLYENGKVFTLLMSDKGDPAFINKLSEMIKSVWVEKNLVDKLTIPQSYAFAAILGMTTSLIAEWVKSDFRETQEEFAQIVVKIFKDIPKNILS